MRITWWLRSCSGIDNIRTDDICGIHRYRDEYVESFEMDAGDDFNNNRRDGFADSDYGSKDSWND